MKKAIIVFLIIAIMASACIAFVACDDDTVTVTVVVRSYGVEDAETYTIKKNVGDTITIADYNALAHPNISFSSLHEVGLYWDSECVFKRDDDLPLDKDTTLYVKRQPGATPAICFILDGKQYNFVTTDNKEVTPFDFIVSAYGKSAIPEEFEFFKDEEMTIPFELEGDNYKECYRDIYNTYKVYVKKNTVRLFKLYCVDDAITQKEQVVLLNIEKPIDEGMIRDLFESIPKECTIEFFADENQTDPISIPKDIFDTNQGEIPTIYFAFRV